MLSIATDYVQDTGCPEPALRRIADAGFSHVHWCHHWNTDFLYARAEVDQIATWLRAFDLKLTDLHASDGIEKCWVSPREYERLAGVELVTNRIAMTARLGSDAIVMHLGDEPEDPAAKTVFWSQVWRSLDALEPVARTHGVRIAVENGVFDPIKKVFERYGPDYVGLCYDAGHGNLSGDGLDELDALKDRLISIHLHDNDGTDDQHKLPFSATVDWARLAGLLAASAYEKCVSMEVGMRNSGLDDETQFLARAFDTGSTLTDMVSSYGQGAP